MNPYPYGSPAYGAPPPYLSPGEKPRVWGWYVAYCVAMALMYFLCFAGGVALTAFAGELGPDSGEMQAQGVLMAVLGLPFFLIYGVAPFLPKKPWTWILHIVLIAVGLTSACCIPAALPLLIYWLKPETKVFFGRAP